MSIIIVLFLFILCHLFLIAPRTSKRNDVLRYNKKMFAHRGYHNKDLGIPENSMTAFQKAIENGYGIELDLHLTKDNKPVVFHDDDLNRMCGDCRSVCDCTLEELKTLTLLDTGERIPQLADVLHLVNGQVPLLIEYKIPHKDTSICNICQEMLDQYTGDYMVQSFNTLGLYWYRKNAPHILRGQLSANLTGDCISDSYVLRFMVKHLLFNVIGRPDFISYKLKDMPQYGVSVCRKLFHTPIAVWTLRTESALEEGLRNYNISIFEKKDRY